jgi:lipopolysaccharide export LptBFGC system permease protein LptF
MTEILLAMFIALLVVILLIISSVWFMNKILTQTVGKRHQALEEIVSTGQLPQAWSIKYHKKLIKLNQKTAPSEEIQKIKQQAKRAYLEKISKLEKYVHSTQLVENEETRKILLDKVKQVRKQWESMPEDII